MSEEEMKKMWSNALCADARKRIGLLRFDGGEK